MENLNQSLIDEKLKSGEWKRCVGCGILTEKINGCNYMKCCARIKSEPTIEICDTEWCWICQKRKGKNINECVWDHPEHNSH